MENDREKIVIHLAGDSLVQGYKQEEFIAGWGQYLQWFFDPEQVEIKNYAKGGRSSRSFINEGRLEQIKREIKKGDYLFIHFCHNDDDTKKKDTLHNRLTPLGNPDETGRFPVVKGEPVPTDLMPAEFFNELTKKSRYLERSVIEAAYNALSQYGDYYYPYSENGVMGTFKWFLLQYVRVARAAKAIPVLITPPPRASFNRDDIHIKDGSGLHGGDNFAYIRAIRQLAKERDVLILDTFNEMRNVFEALGKRDAHYLTAIKSGVLSGEWPKDYIRSADNPASVQEDTHLNKFGAFLMSARLCEDMLIYITHNIARNATESFAPLKDAIKLVPDEFVEAPEPLKHRKEVFNKYFRYDVMNINANNRPANDDSADGQTNDEDTQGDEL
ncbi:MAG: hypothetical protein IJ062_13035 [Firmicutes bacterium]|nr:hypothetical protein [Bacillota bacterium]